MGAAYATTSKVRLRREVQRAMSSPQAAVNEQPPWRSSEVSDGKASANAPMSSSSMDPAPGQAEGVEEQT